MPSISEAVTTSVLPDWNPAEPGPGYCRIAAIPVLHTACGLPHIQYTMLRSTEPSQFWARPKLLTATVCSAQCDCKLTLSYRNTERQRSQLYVQSIRGAGYRVNLDLVIIIPSFLCFCPSRCRNPFHTAWLLVTINQSCSYENWHFPDWFTHCCPRAPAPHFNIFSLKNMKNKSAHVHTHTHAHTYRNLYGIFFAWFDLLVSAPPWTPCRSRDGWFHECSFIKVTLVISGVSHKQQHEPREGGVHCRRCARSRADLHSIVIALKTDYGHTSTRHVAFVLYFSQTHSVVSLKPDKTFCIFILVVRNGEPEGIGGFLMFFRLRNSWSQLFLASRQRWRRSWTKSVLHNTSSVLMMFLGTAVGSTASNFKGRRMNIPSWKKVDQTRINLMTVAFLKDSLAV